MSAVGETTQSPFARLKFGRLVLWPALAIATLFALIFFPPASKGGAALTGGTYVFYGVLMLAALNACRRAGVSIRDILGQPPREARPYAMTPVMALMLLVLAGLCLWMTVVIASLLVPSWATDFLADNDNTAMEKLFRGPQKALLVLNAVVFGPFVEEFVFRGMLLRRWLETRGMWTGLLGSAGVFAILHPPSWLGAFATGIVLGVFYLHTRSLLIPVLIHMLYNGMVATAILASGDGASEAPSHSGGIGALREEWVSLSIGLIITAALIVSMIAPMVRQIRERRALAAAG